MIYVAFFSTSLPQPGLAEIMCITVYAVLSGSKWKGISMNVWGTQGGFVGAEVWADLP